MEDITRFDPEIAEEWRRFPPPTVGNDDIAALRSVWKEYFAQARARRVDNRDDVTVERLLVGSAIDEHMIPVRIYRPTADASGRCLVYIHGGGFVAGDLDHEEERCVSLTREARCLVVAPSYRLAPEHRYPIPLEDCCSVLLWTVANAAEMAIDPRRLAIGGCSAGGALAASVAQRSRDSGGPALAMQLLLYPVLDASMKESSIRALLDDEELRETERMWEDYLGADRSAGETNGASPAHFSDLSGLPPACIVAAELDALRDEAIKYAQSLMSAGVSVELQVWPRVPHAFEVCAPAAAVSRAAVTRQAEAIVRFLG